MYIFDASWNYATIIQCLFGRVENVHAAPKITLKCNRVAQRRVQNVHNACKNVYGALKAELTRRKYSRIFATHRK